MSVPNGDERLVLFKKVGFSVQLLQDVDLNTQSIM
jgi:hypothetical protein